MRNITIALELEWKICDHGLVDGLYINAYHLVKYGSIALVDHPHIDQQFLSVCNSIIGRKEIKSNPHHYK